MTLIALGSEWLATDPVAEAGAAKKPSPPAGPVLRALSRYQAMQRPSNVVWHPEQCSVGVATFEGDPRHAVTLIERKLRAQGEISADVKILTLQTQQVGRGYQVLYVTVALDEWQQMLSWAAAQNHICRLSLAAGLAFKLVKKERAVVLQVGRHFHFFARHDGQLIHLQAVAIDDSAADLQGAVAMLGAQAREDLLARGCGHFEVLWLPAAFSGPRDGLEALTSAFAGAAGAVVDLRCDSLGLLQPAGVEVHSGLPALTRLAGLKDLLNQGDDRSQLLAREYLPYGAAAAVVAALGLAWVSYGWMVDASALRQDVQRLQAQESKVRQSIDAIARDTAIERPVVERQVDLLALMKKVQRDHDPVHFLDALKRGAEGGGIRILSVTSAAPKDEGEGAPPAFLVDGTLPENAINSDRDTRSLSMLVKTLASQGYRAEPVDIRAGATGQGASTRLFSYRVTRVAPVESTGS